LWRTPIKNSHIVPPGVARTDFQYTVLTAHRTVVILTGTHRRFGRVVNIAIPAQLLWVQAIGGR